jgi:hypothetical protein
MPIDFEKRFWDKVDKTSFCWEWLGNKNLNGYGKFWLNGGDKTATRVSAELAGMNITGKIVCHSCDNPGCVNPKHLFVGDTLTNVKDKMSKGRWVGGTNLSVKQRQEIKDLRNQGLTIKEIRSRTGYTIKTIGKWICQ